MEIEVKKLNALKRYSGDFNFEYEPSEDACLIPLCKIAGDVSVSGSYEIYDDDSVGVILTVAYKLEGQCSYCLKNAEKQIVYTSDLIFVRNENEDDYYYDGIKIDLKTAVDDAILISQPNVLLCKDGCEGVDVANNKKEV